MLLIAIEKIQAHRIAWVALDAKAIMLASNQDVDVKNVRWVWVSSSLRFSMLLTDSMPSEFCVCIISLLFRFQSFLFYTSVIKSLPMWILYNPTLKQDIDKKEITRWWALTWFYNAGLIQTGPAYIGLTSVEFARHHLLQLHLPKWYPESKFRIILPKFHHPRSNVDTEIKNSCFCDNWWMSFQNFS